MQPEQLSVNRGTQIISKLLVIMSEDMNGQGNGIDRCQLLLSLPRLSSGANEVE